MPVQSPAEFIEKILPERLSDREKLKGIAVTLQFDISGEAGGKWVLSIADQKAEIREGCIDDPRITLKMKDTDYVSLVNGDISGQKAFMTGKLRFKGDMNTGMKLQRLGII
ncbi:MAG: SCP2 sterol-binding domain-containing protein [Myxococcota bacterium]